MKVLVTLICVLMNVCLVRTVARCKLDNNSRLMLNSINPMLSKLGVQLGRTKDTIMKRWLKNSLYELSDLPLSSVLTTPQNMNKTTPQSTLDINRRILKAFLPQISKIKRQFGAFLAARDVTQQLLEIKWIAGNIVNLIQAIQSVLLKSGQPNTAVNRPIAGTVVNATSSSSGVRASTQSSATVQAEALATSLTLHGIALRASAILDDLYTNVFVMQVDFMILAKTLCR